jgi:hypothetical protein
MYALNSYGETDKTRGTGTVVRGRIGKCQHGLQGIESNKVFDIMLIELPESTRAATLKSLKNTFIYKN